MKIEVYTFYYNPMTEESASVAMSYHKTEQGATKAMEEHKEKERLEWEEDFKNDQYLKTKFGRFHDWYVVKETIEILD